MDFFYTNFLKGVQQKNIEYTDIENLKKLIQPLAKSYHCKMILAFYLPKVASSFLFSILKDMTNYKLNSLSWGYLQNEQNLNFNQIVNTAGQDGLCKLIAKATKANLDLIDLFHFKPFIITRPITDIIVSLRDHFEFNKSGIGNQYDWPQLHVNESFLSFSKTKQLDMIIDHFTPWMVDFLSSWKYQQQIRSDLLWITYDDICHRLDVVIKDVFELNKIDISVKNITSYMEKKESLSNGFDNYYNKGKSGRGIKELSDNQLQRIESFFVHFPALASFI